MIDVFLLLAALAVAAVGTAAITALLKAAATRRRLEAARRERWLSSEEYIHRVNAAQTPEDLRRAAEGNE